MKIFVLLIQILALSTKSVDKKLKKDESPRAADKDDDKGKGGASGGAATGSGGGAEKTGTPRDKDVKGSCEGDKTKDDTTGVYVTSGIMSVAMLLQGKLV